jgi:hypothetical protein
MNKKYPAEQQLTPALHGPLPHPWQLLRFPFYSHLWLMLYTGPWRSLNAMSFWMRSKDSSITGGLRVAMASRRKASSSAGAIHSQACGFGLGLRFALDTCRPCRSSFIICTKFPCAVPLCNGSQELPTHAQGPYLLLMLKRSRRHMHPRSPALASSPLAAWLVSAPGLAGISSERGRRAS